MFVRSLLLLFTLSFYTQPLNAQDIDFNEIIKVLKDLTDAINKIEIDAKNATVIAAEYLEFIDEHWPVIKDYLGSIAQLPTSIENAVIAIEKSLPLITTCGYFVGGCILSGFVIYAIVKVAEYCKNPTKADLMYRSFEGELEP